MSDENVIFAQKPWTLESEADVAELDAEHRVPVALSNRGLDYFLEASVANEILEVFGERPPTPEERCALLMHYAEHDAYPQWVYDR